MSSVYLLSEENEIQLITITTIIFGKGLLYDLLEELTYNEVNRILT